MQLPVVWTNWSKVLDDGWYSVTAFGNDVCMRTIFDHWRWKLVPTGPQTDAACNETKHLADVQTGEIEWHGWSRKVCDL